MVIFWLGGCACFCLDACAFLITSLFAFVPSRVDLIAPAVSLLYIRSSLVALVGGFLWPSNLLSACFLLAFVFADNFVSSLPKSLFGQIVFSWQFSFLGHQLCLINNS